MGILQDVLLLTEDDSPTAESVAFIRTANALASRFTLKAWNGEDLVQDVVERLLRVEQARTQAAAAATQGTEALYQWWYRRLRDKARDHSRRKDEKATSLEDADESESEEISDEADIEEVKAEARSIELQVNRIQEIDHFENEVKNLHPEFLQLIKLIDLRDDRPALQRALGISADALKKLLGRFDHFFQSYCKGRDSRSAGGSNA